MAASDGMERMINGRRYYGRGDVVLGCALAVCAQVAAVADVRLPKLFADNMVLQQQLKAPVWGWADEGEEVTVSFRGQKVKTVAKDGKWLVKLSAMKAGGPDELTVTGKNSITVHNVLVGEVWVCSGQSNMEFPLERSYESKPDIEASANPKIRLFVVSRVKANAPTNDVKGAWKECGPETVPGFTAVGYYFGRDLQKARNVPVGLIESNWGGSPAEVWMQEEVLSGNPRYKEEILDGYARAMKRYEEAKAAYEKKSEEAKAAGTNLTARAPSAPSWKPTELYDGMIAPLIPYAIKGAIWYQGESNAGRAEQYRSLFPDMIRNWRNDWNEGNFTFLAVQLAPYMSIKEEPTESAWAELRESQLNTTKLLPKVGMAVITDVGDPKDIHPTKKRPVGERLALAARGIAYGENVVYSGPSFSKLQIKGDKAVLSFENVGKGLEARDGALKGFAVCGEDHKFVWANAEIEGSKVVVSCASVPKPVAVRYGWADCPVLNLWNKDGLPASPFRTDDFAMVTAGKK
jgi:sialate O-acetylesterase